MDDSWRDLREPHERLRWARIRRTRFDRPTDAARSLNIAPGTYRTYEIAKEDGGRWPPLPVVQKIAKKYGVSWSWIMTGDGGPDAPEQNELQVIAHGVASSLGAVPEDKRADALRAVQGVIEAFARKAG